MPVPIFPNVLSTYGAETSPFGATQTTVSTASSATVLSPPGFYFVQTAAQNTVQFTPDAGGTYTNIIGTSSVGMVWSDGQSVQIKNTSTGTTTAHYWQLLGGAV